MEAEFWHSKWATNVIGFHLDETNAALINYWHHVQPKREDKVLVPLCGKSLDLDWLAQKHDSVIGIELSDIAVKAFFAEQLYTPLVTQLSNHHVMYEFDELTLYSGDFFTAPLEPVELVYDRAALVALPESMRQEYVEKVLSNLKPGGRMLLVTLDYDQQELAGPPFSVPAVDVNALFSECKVTHLYRDDADESHPRIKKGLSRFAEEVWLIEKP